MEKSCTRRTSSIARVDEPLASNNWNLNEESSSASAIVEKSRADLVGLSHLWQIQRRLIESLIEKFLERSSSA